MQNDPREQQAREMNQQNATSSEELNARLNAVKNDIKTGKRKPKKGEFSYETGEPVKRSWTKRILRGATLGVIETILKFVANVMRRVSDKLTGNTSYQDTENAKKTITALNEVSDEETEKLRQLHRSRQQLLAEQHLQQTRMMEDKARAETNALMDEGTKPSVAHNDSGPGGEKRGGSVPKGLPGGVSHADETLKAGLTSVDQDGKSQEILAMLKEAYQEYRETKDQPIDELVEAVYRDIKDPKPGQDSRTAIIKTIHRIYCLHDTKLHGANALQGANALTRVGVNQVMAYEAFISMTHNINQDSNPHAYLKSILSSVRDDSGYDNELMVQTLNFMENTQTQQEALYRTAASPRNRKADLDWAWLVQACKQANETATQAIQGLNETLENKQPSAPQLHTLPTPVIGDAGSDVDMQSHARAEENEITTPDTEKGAGAPKIYEEGDESVSHSNTADYAP